MSISITTTSFDSNYHSSQKAGSNNTDDYVLHNVDIFNTIEFCGHTFHAVYQTAQSYYHNDYSSPSAKLGLSVDGGCDQVLIDIWNEGDFDNSVESDVEEFLHNLEEEYSLELTLENLRDVYTAIADNQTYANAHLTALELSDDLDDYIEDEETNLLELKKAPAEIDVLVAGGSVDYLPKHLCVRFVDAIKARLSLEYPKTEVIVNLDKRLSEGHVYIDGDASGDDAENVRQIISLIWEREEY